MGKYIDKDALVAEIERLISNGQVKLQESQESNDNESYVAWAEHIATCIKVLSFINTLEVKEVDLDGERRKYLTEHFNVYEDGILQSKRSNLPLETYDVIKIAKHFFELGMAVSNKAQKGE